MTNGEQKVLWRGIAAGTLVGLALGLMTALFIARRPGVGAVITFIAGLAVAVSMVIPAVSGLRKKQTA